VNLSVLKLSTSSGKVTAFHSLFFIYILTGFGQIIFRHFAYQFITSAWENTVFRVGKKRLLQIRFYRNQAIIWNTLHKTCEKSRAICCVLNEDMNFETVFWCAHRNKVLPSTQIHQILCNVSIHHQPKRFFIFMFCTYHSIRTLQF
jgi:hypothetical protein